MVGYCFLIICFISINAEEIREQNWIDGGKLQGDIGMSPEDLAWLVERDNAVYTEQFNAPEGSRLAAVRFPDYLWPNGRVPYRFSPTFKPSQIAEIKAAMGEIESKSCVRFHPIEGPPRGSHVHIRRLFSCFSESVGRKQNSLTEGEQVLSLDWGCFERGTILHELMHTLGFFHEQSRADRDEYVRIIEQNILEGKLAQFDKISSDRITHLDSPYDYGSIMHYPRNAFSIDEKRLDTIEPLKIGPPIGNRNGLSEWDVVKINRLYNCPEARTEPTGFRSLLECLELTDVKRVCPILAATGKCFEEGRFCKMSCCIHNASKGVATIDKETPDKLTTQNPVTTTTTIRTTTGQRTFIDCSNKNDTDTRGHCPDWAAKGECDSNPAYMLVQCALSCCQTGEQKSFPSCYRSDPGHAYETTGSHIKNSHGESLAECRALCDAEQTCLGINYWPKVLQCNTKNAMNESGRYASGHYDAYIKGCGMCHTATDIDHFGNDIGVTMLALRSLDQCIKRCQLLQDCRLISFQPGWDGGCWLKKGPSTDLRVTKRRITYETC